MDQSKGADNSAWLVLFMYCRCEIPRDVGWGLQNMSFPINNWMKVVLEVYSRRQYYQFSSIQRNHLCIFLQIVSSQALIFYLFFLPAKKIYLPSIDSHGEKT